MNKVKELDTDLPNLDPNNATHAEEKEAPAFYWSYIVVVHQSSHVVIKNMKGSIEIAEHTKI